MKAREEEHLLVDEDGNPFVTHAGTPMRVKRTIIFQHWFLRAILFGLLVLALSLLAHILPRSTETRTWAIIEPWLEGVLTNLGSGILLTVGIAFFVEKVGWVRAEQDQ